MAHVQIGCGFTAGEGWLNFDSSPTLRIERLPVIGKRLGRMAGNATPFPPEVRYGDIISGLPLAPGSADAIYASHVLEHLSREDMTAALANCFDLLKPGGKLRLIVPDLQARAARYLDALAQGDAGASDDFMRSTYLGMETRPRGLLGVLRRSIGNAAHLWMWDALSIESVLLEAGFRDIRRVEFGDSDDPMFKQVESHDRFVDDGIVEIAVQAQKPGAD